MEIFRISMASIMSSKRKNKIRMMIRSIKSFRISSLLTFKILGIATQIKESPSMIRVSVLSGANCSESENRLSRIINTFMKSIHMKVSSRSSKTRISILSQHNKFFHSISSTSKTSKKSCPKTSLGT